MNFNLLRQGGFGMQDPRVQSFQSASLKQVTRSAPLPTSTAAKPASAAEEAVNKLSGLFDQRSLAAATIKARLSPANQELLQVMLETADNCADGMLSAQCLGALDEAGLAKAMDLFSMLFPLGADGKPHPGPYANSIKMIPFGCQDVDRIGESVKEFFASLTEVVKELGGDCLQYYLSTCRNAARWGQDMSKVYACFGRLAKDSPETFAWNNSLFRDFDHRPNGIADFECIVANLGTDQGWGTDRLKDFQAMLYDYAKQYASRDELIDTLLLDIKTCTDLGALSAEYLRLRGLPTAQPAPNSDFEQVLSMDRDARAPIVMRQGEAIALYADGQGSRTWTLLESGESDSHEPLFDLSDLAPGVHHLFSSDQTQGRLRNLRLQTLIILPQDAPAALQAQINAPAASGQETRLRSKAEAILSRAQESKQAFGQRLQSLFTTTPEQNFSSKEITWYNLPFLHAAIDYSLIVKDEQGQDKAYENKVWQAYLDSLTGAVRSCGCGKKNGSQPGQNQTARAQSASITAPSAPASGQPATSLLTQPVRQLLAESQPEAQAALRNLLDDRYYALLDQVMASNARYVEIHRQLSKSGAASLNVDEAFTGVHASFQRWLNIA